MIKNITNLIILRNLVSGLWKTGVILILLVEEYLQKEAIFSLLGPVFKILKTATVFAGN
jgi:hypothetical protein